MSECYVFDLIYVMTHSQLRRLSAWNVNVFL